VLVFEPTTVRIWSFVRRSSLIFPKRSSSQRAGKRRQITLSSRERHANHETKRRRALAPAAVSERLPAWSFRARRQFSRGRIARGNEHSPGDGLRKERGNAGHYRALTSGGYTNELISAIDLREMSGTRAPLAE
jgi:hypothetical protein